MKKISKLYFFCVYAVLVSGFPQSARAQEMVSDPNAIRNFVRQVYFEGVPFDQVNSISANAAIPVLLPMLNDLAEEEFYSNIVVTLGMLGDDRAVDPMINFITQKEGSREVSNSKSIAKSSAVMSLGYIVNKTGNAKALDFLREGVDPEVWTRRKLTWVSKHVPTAKERDNQMAVMSMLGLGISGHKDAKKILLDLKTPAPRSRFSVIRSEIQGFEGVVDDALKAHDEISRNGIRKYYEKVQPDKKPVSRDKETLVPEERLKQDEKGQVLKKSQAGEIIRESREGEVLKNPQDGEILKKPQDGEVLDMEKIIEKNN